MSDRPSVSARYAGYAGPGTGLAAGLERALTEVRAGAPRYRRWWIHEHGARATPNHDTPPWSEGDEERAAELGAVDPWWMRAVADELERAHTDLRDVAAELAQVAGSAIGAASERCRLLAAAGHERASEAARLAAGVRAAGERADELLDDVARRLTEALEGDPSTWQPGWRETCRPGWGETCRPGWGEAGSRGAGSLGWGAAGPREAGSPGWGAADAPGPGEAGSTGSRGESDPNDGFGGYAAILRAVRAELSSALDRLPSLFEPHAARPADSAGWAASGGVNGWTPEPGTGPRLPETDARRVETDTGVRIARLPDGPR